MADIDQQTGDGRQRLFEYLKQKGVYTDQNQFDRDMENEEGRKNLWQNMHNGGANVSWETFNDMLQPSLQQSSAREKVQAAEVAKVGSGVTSDNVSTENLGTGGVKGDAEQVNAGQAAAGAEMQAARQNAGAAAQQQGSAGINDFKFGTLQNTGASNAQGNDEKQDSGNTYQTGVDGYTPVQFSGLDAYDQPKKDTSGQAKPEQALGGLMGDAVRRMRGGEMLSDAAYNEKKPLLSKDGKVVEGVSLQFGKFGLYEQGISDAVDDYWQKLGKGYMDDIRQKRIKDAGMGDVSQDRRSIFGEDQTSQYLYNGIKAQVADDPKVVGEILQERCSDDLSQMAFNLLNVSVPQKEQTGGDGAAMDNMQRKEEDPVDGELKDLFNLKARQIASRMGRELSKRMEQQYVDEYGVKSAGDYYLGKVFEDNFTASLYNVMMRKFYGMSDYREQLRQQAYVEYMDNMDAGVIGKTALEGVTFASQMALDSWLFGMGGKVGAAAVKAASRGAISAASGSLGRQILFHSITSGSSFAGYGMSQNAIQQWGDDTNDFSVGKLLETGGEEFLKGATMGVTGTIIGAGSKGVERYLAGKGKWLGRAGSVVSHAVPFTGEVGTFTAMGALEEWAKNGVSLVDYDWGKSFVQNGANIFAMKLGHKIFGVNRKDENQPKVQLSDYQREMLDRSGYLKQIEDLDKPVSGLQNDAEGKAVKPKYLSEQEREEKRRVILQQIADDQNMPQTLRAIAVYELTGRMGIVKPADSHKIENGEDGTMTIKVYDADGGLVDELKMKADDGAKYCAKLGVQETWNRAYTAENGLSSRMSVIDEAINNACDKLRCSWTDAINAMNKPRGARLTGQEKQIISQIEQEADELLANGNVKAMQDIADDIRGRTGVDVRGIMQKGAADVNMDDPAEVEKVQMSLNEYLGRLAELQQGQENMKKAKSAAIEQRQNSRSAGMAVAENAARDPAAAYQINQDLAGKAEQLNRRSEGLAGKLEDLHRNSGITAVMNYLDELERIDPELAGQAREYIGLLDRAAGYAMGVDKQVNDACDAEEKRVADLSFTDTDGKQKIWAAQQADGKVLYVKSVADDGTCMVAVVTADGKPVIDGKTGKPMVMQRRMDTMNLGEKQEVQEHNDQFRKQTTDNVWGELMRVFNHHPETPASLPVGSKVMAVGKDGVELTMQVVSIDENGKVGVRLAKEGKDGVLQPYGEVMYFDSEDELKSYYDAYNQKKTEGIARSREDGVIRTAEDAAKEDEAAKQAAADAAAKQAEEQRKAAEEAEKARIKKEEEDRKAAEKAAEEKRKAEEKAAAEAAKARNEGQAEGQASGGEARGVETGMSIEGTRGGHPVRIDVGRIEDGQAEVSVKDGNGNEQIHTFMPLAEVERLMQGGKVTYPEPAAEGEGQGEGQIEGQNSGEAAPADEEEDPVKKAADELVIQKGDRQKARDYADFMVRQYEEELNENEVGKQAADVRKRAREEHWTGEQKDAELAKIYDEITKTRDNAQRWADIRDELDGKRKAATAGEDPEVAAARQRAMAESAARGGREMTAGEEAAAQPVTDEEKAAQERMVAEARESNANDARQAILDIEAADGNDTGRILKTADRLKMAVDGMKADPQTMQSLMDLDRGLRDRKKGVSARVDEIVKARVDDINARRAKVGERSMSEAEVKRLRQDITRQERQKYDRMIGIVKSRMKAVQAESGAADLEEVENGEGEVVMTRGDGNVEFNVASARDPESRAYMREIMEDMGLTAEEADDVFNSLDGVISEVMKIARKYPTLRAWQEKGLEKTRFEMKKYGLVPKTSAFRNNGEYKYNIDLGSLCTKREALDVLMQKVVSEGWADKLGTTQIQALRDVLKKYGYLVQCDMCFVETKRGRAATQANDFAFEWNAVCDALGLPQTDVRMKRIFDEGMIGTGAGLMTEERRAILERMANKDISDIPEDKRRHQRWKVDKDGNRMYVKKDGKFKLDENGRKIPAMEDLDHGITADKAQKIAKVMLKDPRLLGRWNADWEITTEDSDKFETEFSDSGLPNLLAAKFGAATAKPMRGYVNYDPLSWKTKFDDAIRGGDRHKLERVMAGIYGIGGFRGQSFTDFNPMLTFDYVQHIVDDAIRNLPEHQYTKVKWHPMLFGETGMMINMSIVSGTDKSLPDELAGFKRDENGKFVYNNGEVKIYEEGDEGTRMSYQFLEESFPMEGANNCWELRRRPEYGGRVGVIVVGVGDHQIRQLLRDGDIDMVIPYHASGMDEGVKVKTGLDTATDYTDFQNTKNEPSAKDRESREYAKRMRDLKVTDVNGREVSMSACLYDNGLFSYNMALQVLGDPKKAASAYLDWCKAVDATPKFEQFSGEDGYYKLLEDFRGYDNDGKPVIQGAVRLQLPKNFSEILNEAMKDRAHTEEMLSDIADNDEVWAEVEERLKYQRLDGDLRNVFVDRLRSVVGQKNVIIKEQSQFMDLVGKALETSRGFSEQQKQLLRTSDGQIYGFMKDGKIYLNENTMNAHTPVHEFGHLWAKVVQIKNPELWKRGVKLLEQSEEWQEVLKERAYANIHGDRDAMASEVLSRIIGRMNEDYVRDLMNPEKARPSQLTLKEKIWEWLKEMWGSIRDTFGDNYRGLTLEEFQRMPLRDLLDRQAGDVFKKKLSDLRRAGKMGGELEMEGENMEQSLADSFKEAAKQDFGSAGTSINGNKLPAGFALVDRQGGWKEGGVNLDMGGGRFDNATHMLSEKGVENLVFDPYNRDAEHNRKVAERVRQGGVDSVTCNNCLNVINTRGARSNVILQCAKALKEGGTAYFTIYEGNGTGVGKVSKNDCWQENRKTRDYIDEISEHFGDVEVKGKLIIARDPLVGGKTSVWNYDASGEQGMQFMNTDRTEVKEPEREGGVRLQSEMQKYSREDLEQGKVKFNGKLLGDKESRFKVIDDGKRKFRNWYGSTQQRYRDNVGKQMGGIYLHKDYATEVIPEDVYRSAEKAAADKGLQYNCVYYDPKTPDVVRFDEAPDFDTAREPITGRYWKIDSRTGEIVGEGNSRQIWHNKWMWVKDDYKGFDVDEAYEWSKRWNQLISNPDGIAAKWEYLLEQAGLPIDWRGSALAEQGGKTPDGGGDGGGRPVRREGESFLDYATRLDDWQRGQEDGGERKSLVGVHNISVANLKKALKMGGFANPSVAVIDADKSGFDEFGEVSVVMPKRMIDQSTGGNAGTWTGDVWTPTYPKVYRRFTGKGEKAFEKLMDSVEGEKSFKSWYMRNELNEMEQGHDPDLRWLFLKERGIDATDYRRAGFISTWQDVMDDHESAESLQQAMEKDEKLRASVNEMATKWLEGKIEEENPELAFNHEDGVQEFRRKRQAVKAIIKEKYTDEDGNLKDDVVKDAYSDQKAAYGRKGMVENLGTLSRADQLVHKKGWDDEYEQWLESKLGELGTEEMLFKGYSRSGKKQYVPNTLDNASQMMNNDKLTGGGNFGGWGTFAGKVYGHMGSLDEIRASKDKLGGENEGRKFVKDNFSNMCYILHDHSSDLDLWDGGAARALADIVMHSGKDVAKYVKRRWKIDLDEDEARQMTDFVNAFKTSTEDYFETKFNRVVGVDEAAAVVVPKNLDEATRKALADKGLRVFEYDPEVEGDRRRALADASHMDDVSFMFVGDKGVGRSAEDEKDNWRHENKKRAFEMVRGVYDRTGNAELTMDDRRRIKYATGWEQGKDGRWRYEERGLQPDVKSWDDDMISRIKAGDVTLGELLGEDGRELMKMYPELAKFEVNDRASGSGAMDIEGRNLRINLEDLIKRREELGEQQEIYDDSMKRISEADIDEETRQRAERVEKEQLKKAEILLEDAEAELIDTINHEVQHGVQAIEGFAQGGSPEMVERYRQWVDAELLDLNGRMQRAGFGAWCRRMGAEKVAELASGDDLFAAEKEFVKSIDDDEERQWLEGEISYSQDKIEQIYEQAGGREAHDNMSAYDWYRSLAGEVEARNAGRRAGMTEDERRSSLGQDTEDVDRDEQIVRYGDEIQEMGSRYNKKRDRFRNMVDGEGLQGNKKVLYDVFSDNEGRGVMHIERNDGTSVDVELVRGKEDRLGAKHSLFNHYGEEGDDARGRITSGEIMKIDDVISSNNYEEQDGSRRLYTMNVDGVDIKVLTQVKADGKEKFLNAYTNRRGSNASRDMLHKEATLANNGSSRTAVEPVSGSKGTDNSGDVQVNHEKVSADLNPAKPEINRMTKEDLEKRIPADVSEGWKDHIRQYAKWYERAASEGWTSIAHNMGERMRKIEALERKERKGRLTDYERQKLASYRAVQQVAEEILKEHGLDGEELDIKTGKVDRGYIKNLFGRCNEDEENRRLFDKVWAIAERLGVEYRFDNRSDDLGNEQGGFIHLRTDFFRSGYIDGNRKAETILHETIHGVTSYAIDMFKAGRLTDNNLAEACRRLTDLYNEVKSMDDAGKFGKKHYGLSNMHEMIAEMSNPEFREEMKKVNIWTALVGNVKAIIMNFAHKIGLTDADAAKFGMTKSDAYAELDSALDKFLNSANGSTFDLVHRASALDGRNRMPIHVNVETPEEPREEGDGASDAAGGGGRQEGGLWRLGRNGKLEYVSRDELLREDAERERREQEAGAIASRRAGLRDRSMGGRQRRMTEEGALDWQDAVAIEMAGSKLLGEDRADGTRGLIAHTTGRKSDVKGWIATGKAKQGAETPEEMAERIYDSMDEGMRANVDAAGGVQAITDEIIDNARRFANGRLLMDDIERRHMEADVDGMEEDVEQKKDEYAKSLGYDTWDEYQSVQGFNEAEAARMEKEARDRYLRRIGYDGEEDYQRQMEGLNRAARKAELEQQKRAAKEELMAAVKAAETRPEIPHRREGEDFLDYAQRVALADKAQREYDRNHPVETMTRKDAMRAVRERIDEELKRDSVSSMDKRTLGSILRTLESTDVVNLQESIDEATRLVRHIEMKANQSDIDRLLKLKVDDQNQKGVSIAKNVDDRTRKLMKALSSRIVDIETSGLEDQIHELRSENWHLRDERRTIDPAGERAKEIERRLQENSEKIDSLEKEREMKLIERTQRGDVSVDMAIDQLKRRMDDEAAEGKEASEDELVQMAALQLHKMVLDGKQLDGDIMEMEQQRREMKMAKGGLWEQYRDRLEAAKAAVDEEGSWDNVQRWKQISAEYTRKRDAYNLKIAGMNRLITEAEAQKIQSQEAFREALAREVEGGKESLLEQVKNMQKRRLDLLSGSMHDIIGGKERATMDDKENEKNTDEKWYRRIFTSALSSFEYMAQSIATKTLGKDSYFYRTFVLGEGGVIEAKNTYIRGMKSAREKLDEKVQEIFGERNDNDYGKGIDTFADWWNRMDETPKDGKWGRKHGVKMNGRWATTGISVIDMNKLDEDGQPTGERVERTDLSKGQAAYVYMLWKMADGRAKLEMMGFDDESIEAVKDYIGEGNVKMADWLQKDFLVEERDKINQRHLEMYNTSMADIENYVPIKINSGAVREEIDLSGDTGQGAGKLVVKTGAIINRKANTNPVDLNWSAAKVIWDHLDEVEDFYAYAPVRRDLGWVLSAQAFRNQLNKNRAGSFKRLVEAAKVATHADQKGDSGSLDRVMGTIQKGLVGGNIAFRNNTALKQMLSVPAFLGYSQDPRFLGAFVKNMFKIYGGNAPALVGNMATFGLLGKRMFTDKERSKGALKLALTDDIKWCIDNLPDFWERVLKGTAGESSLDTEGISGAVGKFIDGYLEVGMRANQMVDALTCAIGIKTIYDYKMARAKDRAAELGLDGDERTQFMAEERRKALMESTIYYNGTQQSNHEAFLSPQQVGRSFVDRSLSLYQNASIGYARRFVSSMKDLGRLAHWSTMVGNYARQDLRSQGIDPKNATEAEMKAARSKAGAYLFKETRKKAFDAAWYGFVLNWVWDFGGKGLLGMLQDDDDEEKNLLDRLAELITYPARGTAGMNMIGTMATGGKMTMGLQTDEINDFLDNWKKAQEKYGLVSPELGYLCLERAARFGGVKLDVWSNTYLGVERAINELPAGDRRDLVIDLMFLLNSPNSQRAAVAKKLYREKYGDNWKDHINDYMHDVEMAMKYIDDPDQWADWIPNKKTLSDAVEAKLKKEFIEKSLTPEEKQWAEEKKGFDERLKTEDLEGLGKMLEEEKSEVRREEIIKQFNKLDKKSHDSGEQVKRDEVDEQVKNIMGATKSEKEDWEQGWIGRMTASEMQYESTISRNMRDQKEKVDRIKKRSKTIRDTEGDAAADRFEEEAGNAYQLEKYDEMKALRQEITDMKKDWWEMRQAADEQGAGDMEKAIRMKLVDLMRK